MSLPLPINELISRVLAGDHVAEQKLADHVYKLVYSYMRQCGRSHSDAHDIALRSISKVRLVLESYKEGAFKAWVKAITRRLVLDDIRALKGTLWESFDDPDCDARTVVSCDEELPSPVMAALQRASAILPGGQAGQGLPEPVANALHEALQLLPVEDVMIVEARVCDIPVEFKELATQLGCKPNTVQKRHERAKDKLRALLASDSRIIAWLAAHRA
jgi:RNA polymerase sigma factor (sigma-70 family)